MSIQPIVLVDACVLVNPMRRNLLFVLSEAGYCQLRWSDKILSETRHTLVKLLTRRSYEDADARATHIVEFMQQAFDDAVVEDYEECGQTLGKLRDEDDRHVIAAAVKCNATTIITENTRDFPKKKLAQFKLKRATADEFFTAAFEEVPRLSLAAIERLCVRYATHGKTRNDMMEHISHAQLRKFAKLLDQHDSLH